MIRWTTREWELIARHLKSRHVEPRHHGWRAAVVKAMRFCLPEERWRTSNSLNESKKILGPIMQRLEIADNAHPPEPKPLPLQKYGTDELVVELVNRVTRMLLDELRAEIKVLTTPQFIVAPKFKHDPCAPSTERPTKPVVLVVGPKNGQQRELEERFDGFLELHFVASHENPSLIIGRGSFANHVVLWTDFISHAHQEQAKKLNANLQYVSGGMSALHGALARLQV